MQKVKCIKIFSAYCIIYYMQFPAKYTQQKKEQHKAVPFFIQIKMPLQWSTSCWMIWAVQPEKVLMRFWKSSLSQRTLIF